MNKLAIIGGSGLYSIEGIKNEKWLSISTPWGNPSDEILEVEIKIRLSIFYQDMQEGIKLIHRISILEQTLML